MLAMPNTTDIHRPLVHAPIAALIVDPNGVVAWGNATAATLLAEPDAGSLRLNLIYMWFGEDDAEALRQMFEVYFNVPIESREAWTRQMLLKAPDGSRPIVSLTLTPIVCQDGERAVVYLRNMTREITAERRFTQMFESLPLGVVVVDGRGRIAQANSTLSNQFGWKVEQMIGQPLSMLLPERYREKHDDQIRAFAAEPSSRMMGRERDLTGLHRHGREFPVEVALTLLESSSQPLYMGIVSDISHRKRAERALQQTNSQLEEFTYVASHDLRSPLRGIGDLVSWIREDLEGIELPEEVTHNFARIDQRIQRCEQMIDDLLDYARAGVRDPQMQRIDPHVLVEEALELTAIPDGFEVDVDVQGGDLIAPRAPLSTSLRNLLSNAVKHHGGSEGRISITMREEGRFSIFTVDDDGQGVPPGNEERIFKLFHRASPSTDGDGVGLAFTRRMINAHGGMVTVQGRGPLGGARFEVHWPRILLRENEDD